MKDYRRVSGSVENPVALGWRVEDKNRQRVIELARKSEMSAAAFFDLMVENLDLDDRGIPPWVPYKDEEELPITKT
uniref:hypothetical protein n=1 Tax=Arthrobacter sp. TaxID=1667 RepID=UPI000EB6A098|nr:hypothetical protein [Arthrobacter sp.]AXV46545.1 hypothetical protein pA58H1_p28 [Arthrobacter sp.]